MESYLQMCLILGVTAVLYSASIPHSSSPQQQPPVDDALDVYNGGLSSSGFLFGLLQDESPDNGTIRFIIKETVCLKTAKKDEKCPFKEDGVVKNCTASLPGSDGRLLEVRCETVDTSDDTLQNEENKKPKTVRSHRIFQLLRTNKKKLETNFLQFDNKSSVESQAAASCLICIFDYFDPKWNSG